MNYIRSEKYNTPLIQAKIMGPNPLKIQEELLGDHKIPSNAVVCDLWSNPVVSTDSYNYFGRDPSYLGEKLLPFVKHGGSIYIAIPGMKKDCHDNLPPELLLSWTPEQLDYMHDVAYWRNIVAQTDEVNILSIHEMESNDEVWSDWLGQENEYAVNDRKAMEAGAGKYLNFIAMILQKK